MRGLTSHTSHGLGSPSGTRTRSAGAISEEHGQHASPAGSSSFQVHPAALQDLPKVATAVGGSDFTCWRHPVRGTECITLMRYGRHNSTKPGPVVLIISEAATYMHLPATTVRSAAERHQFTIARVLDTPDLAALKAIGAIQPNATKVAVMTVKAFGQAVRKLQAFDTDRLLDLEQLTKATPPPSRYLPGSTHTPDHPATHGMLPPASLDQGTHRTPVRPGTSQVLMLTAPDQTPGPALSDQRSGATLGHPRAGNQVTAPQGRLLSAAAHLDAGSANPGADAPGLPPAAPGPPAAPFHGPSLLDQRRDPDENGDSSSDSDDDDEEFEEGEEEDPHT